MRAIELQRLLGSFRFSFLNEDELQSAIEDILVELEGPVGWEISGTRY